MNFPELRFDHFQHDETSNDEQYRTPLPSKDNSPNENESESIEVVETPSKTYCEPLQESTISSASTNNTDICILDPHFANDLQFLPDDVDIENHGSDKEISASDDGDDVFLHDTDVLDTRENFTVLEKPTKSRHIICNCEESTEVLMLINSEYEERRKPSYSGADSDVEILMSEELNESDWLSSSGFEKNAEKSLALEGSTKGLKLNINFEQEDVTPSDLQKSYDEISFKTQTSTDLEILGAEFHDIDKENDKYHNFNRLQLLHIIKKQELCIQALEATVERYEKAQQRLFEHVDALRLELSELRVTPLQIEDKNDHK